MSHQSTSLPMLPGKRRLLALCVFAAALNGLPAASWAAAVGSAHPYSIQAGSLSRALAQFAAESQVTVQFAPELTRGLSSSGLNGRFSVEQGLAVLLAGSGLEAVRLSEGVYGLIKQAGTGDTLTLGATNISSAAVESAWGPVDGIVAKRSASGSKTDSALSEIPQTINVVTQDEITLRGSRTVTEALRYTPGMTVGGRYDVAETDNKAPLAGTHSNVKDEKFTGRAGLGYQFDNGLTPYISYAESFLPQTGTNASGNPFEPTSGKQYEAGIKYEPKAIDGFIQLSVYQIDQENMLTNDLSNPMFSIQSGAVRSRGVELESKLNVTKNLRMMAAVSRNQNKWHSSNDGREGRTVASRPPLTASAWVDYSFDASALAGLGAGLGVRYVRGSYGSDYDDAFQIPSYTVYDAMLSYDLEKSPLHVKGVALKLNLENLTDKKYVSSCGSDLDCYYGESRTLTADVTYNW